MWQAAPTWGKLFVERRAASLADGFRIQAAQHGLTVQGTHYIPGGHFRHFYARGAGGTANN